MVKRQVILIHLVMLFLVFCLYASDRKPKIAGLQDSSGQIHLDRHAEPDGNLVRQFRESEQLRNLSAGEKVRLIAKHFRGNRVTSSRPEKSARLLEARIEKANKARQLRLRSNDGE